MKRLIHIGALPLAAYLLALPIFLGLHKLEHKAHQAEHQDAQETVFQAADCSLCEVYQNQSGVIALPFTCEGFVVDSPSDTHIPQGIVCVSTETLYLRGPPAC